MFRAVLLGLIALAASANAFVGLVAPMPRSVRSSGGVQMVTSPRVSTPPSTTGMPASEEPIYTAALQKMEKEAMADLEKTFDDIAKKAKAESDAIWSELNKEFDEMEE